MSNTPWHMMTLFRRGGAPKTSRSSFGVLILCRYFADRANVMTMPGRLVFYYQDTGTTYVLPPRWNRAPTEGLHASARYLRPYAQRHPRKQPLAASRASVESSRYPQTCNPVLPDA